jgi:phosphopantothenoylcysteine synthetase/decarboxylase
MRPVLVVGGAPRIPVDAVRHLTMAASGATAVALRARLTAAGSGATLLLSGDAAPGVADAQRYGDRPGLESALQAWIAAHPDGVVVMSAAVNDYAVSAVELHQGATVRTFAPGAKIPSQGDELVIRLRPAAKLIDGLRAWGLRGPVIGFKYEDRATVLPSAAALRARTGAALVVANSLCGGVQALVDGDGERSYPDRGALLDALAERIRALAS